MLAALSHSERTAGELGEPFRISQPAASKHIRVLADAGLVTVRSEGRHRRFRLNPHPLNDAQAWLERHRKFWEGALSQLDTLLTDLQKGRPR
jgi:DNA-binding transcriptional ArsR family regulator